MPYTTVLRWKEPDPALELETCHAGFAIPEEAAIFASAFSETSPARLKLGRTGLRLFLVEGTSPLNLQSRDSLDRRDPRRRKRRLNHSRRRLPTVPTAPQRNFYRELGTEGNSFLEKSRQDPLMRDLVLIASEFREPLGSSGGL